MCPHMVFADRFGNPCPRGSGIHHGFEGRERLARDQAKRGFWVQPASHQLKIMAINVGDKVHPWSRSAGPQRLNGHSRPQVRPTNSNVDDVSERHTTRTLNLAISDRIRKGKHPIKLLGGVPNRVFTIDFDGMLNPTPQRHMEHRSIFTGVDALPGEHGVTRSAQLLGFRMFEECRQDISVDEMTGQVQASTGELKLQAFALGQRDAFLQSERLSLRGELGFGCCHLASPLPQGSITLVWMSSGMTAAGSCNRNPPKNALRLSPR